MRASRNNKIDLTNWYKPGICRLLVANVWKYLFWPFGKVLHVHAVRLLSYLWRKLDSLRKKGLNVKICTLLTFLYIWRRWRWLGTIVCRPKYRKTSRLFRLIRVKRKCDIISRQKYPTIPAFLFTWRSFSDRFCSFIFLKKLFKRLHYGKSVSP